MQGTAPLAWLAVSVIVAGCSLAPEFMRPETVVEEVKQFRHGPQAVEDAQRGAAMTAWWERINDPLLMTYVSRLKQHNLSLKEAGERVLQARARLDVQQGDWFPQLSANNQANRSFRPVNSIGFPGAQGADRFFNTVVNSELQASWQLDLFGRVRSAVDAAEATLQASEADRQALLHSLIADVMRRRVAIATTQTLLELAKEAQENRQTIYDAARKRYRLGSRNTALSDVYLAEENLRAATTDVNALQRQLTDERYRLDVLLGQPPGTNAAHAARFPLMPPPRDVALCVPAALLDRRPDLRASALRAKAANADIGVAMANLFPDLTISGNYGVSGRTFQGLYSSEQLAGSILGSITARLFEGGTLRANIRLREAQARELAAAYAGDVLTALREVETALSAEVRLREEVEQQRRSVTALRNADTINEARYRRGVIPLQEWLDTQQRRYAAEQQWRRLQQQLWNNRVALYLALGGDWLPAEEQDATDDTSPCPAIAGEEADTKDGAEHGTG